MIFEHEIEIWLPSEPSLSNYFAGFIPYNEWKCLSARCFNLQANHTDKEFYTQDTVCRNSLQPGVDLMWNTNRTSYATEWNLICANEDKATNLESFFFLGAFIGVIPGSYLLDTVGRKAVILTAILIASLATLANAFINSYSVMLCLRIVQGLASFLIQTGVQAMIMEFTPTKLRNVASILTIFCWSIGISLCVGLSYFLYSWRHIFFVTSIAIILTALPALFCPESARFHLIKGKEAEAKRTFGRLAKLFNSPIALDNVELDYSDYKQSYLKQIKDFAKYPTMTKNTVLLLLYYLVVSAHTYSLTYGWGKLGANLFTSQALSIAAGCSVIFTGYQYLVTERLGRKRALAVNTFLVTLLSLLAIPKVVLTESWTLSQIMCLLSCPFNASCWMGVLLLAAELAPTSHRGIIVCLNTVSSRVGSFVGPYMTLLFNVLDIRIVIAIFSALPLLGVVLVLFCEDSTDKPIPSTPAEVRQARRVGKEEDDDSPLLCEE